LLRTVSWLHRPKRLWAGVPMACAFNFWRAVLIGLGGFLVSHVIAIALFLYCDAQHNFTTSLVYFASGMRLTRGSGIGTPAASIQAPTFLDHLAQRAVHTEVWLFPYIDFSARGSRASPPQAACMILLFMVIMPLTLFVAPATLRKHKVQPRHILRVGIYSLWLIPFSGVCVPALLTLGWSFGDIGTLHNWNSLTPTGPWSWLQQLIENQASKIIAVLIGTLVLSWWWAAISRYLRLPQAWLITIILGCLAAVGTFALSFLIPGLSDYVPAVLNELLPGRSPITVP
ncbi:MAG: hypothetical protein AABZ53_10270, partial [Planctomycetota bacterium]